jgi:hypothetical protein
MIKDKKWRYESFAERPSISKEKIDKAFYELTKPKAPAASSKRLAANLIYGDKKSGMLPPSYSDEYLDLMVPVEELEDIKKQLNVSPMVRIRKPDLRKGLPNILLADASNKPPTLEDYLRLGITISQLSEEERKTVQQMLDATLNRKEEK